MISLASISQNLLLISNTDEFDKWFLQNENDLINFFYINGAAELENLNFDDFYFRNFLPSEIYKNYHQYSTSSICFEHFFNLLALASEKLALNGSCHVLLTLINDIPESSNKYRLLAIKEFSELDDIRTGYFDCLSKVLEYLDKSIIDFEDGGTRLTIDVIISFFNKAKQSFLKFSLSNELNTLKILLSEESVVSKYPFLNNLIIIDLINDKNTLSLTVNDYTRTCLEPSASAKKIFNKINSDYFGHPRINHDNNNLWGYDRKYILDYILVRGRGDYTKDSGEITTEDKVLLYCFFNLKKHYFTTYGVFETVIDSLKGFFNNDIYKPTFIDLGCGPMTSGLALADLINTLHSKPIIFSYIGIDISESMIKKANELERLDIFSHECDFNYYDHWKHIDYKKIYKKGINNPIIFNASYLFASDSLIPEELARSINIFSKQFKNVYFIFQNPNRVDRNVKYVKFKGMIKYEVIKESQEIIKYKASSYVSQEEVYYEILKIIPL